MRRRGRRFFERGEAKAETTFSRANALLHITFTFFETRETQHETRARSFAHIWCFLVVARSCVHRMGIQSHVFAVALHTSTRHASFESVDDVIVFRLVPDTPERLPERPASLLPRSARLDGEVHVILLLHLVHGVHVGGAREPEQRARDEVVAWRALARPVVGRQVVQTHAVFALALRHRARPCPPRPLRLRGAASRAAVSDPTARDSMWPASGRTWLFRAELETFGCAFLFFREEEKARPGRSRKRPPRNEAHARLKLKVATCLLCLLPRASRARLSESDQSTSIMKSAQPSGKPGSYEDRRETHGFLVTSLVPTRS